MAIDYVLDLSKGFHAEFQCISDEDTAVITYQRIREHVEQTGETLAIPDPVAVFLPYDSSSLKSLKGEIEEAMSNMPDRHCSDDELMRMINSPGMEEYHEYQEWLEDQYHQVVFYEELLVEIDRRLNEIEF